jgi:hypothetical protein
MFVCRISENGTLATPRHSLCRPRGRTILRLFDWAENFRNRHSGSPIYDLWCLADGTLSMWETGMGPKSRNRVLPPAIHRQAPANRGALFPRAQSYEPR